MNKKIIILIIFIAVLGLVASGFYYRDYFKKDSADEATEIPRPTFPPVDKTQPDITVVTDNNKPRQVVEGFGASHQTLVYGGGLGDVLTTSLRKKALDALFNQVKITTGQIPTVFEAPANSTLSNFYPNQANDDNDPLNLNWDGFSTVLGDTFKKKVVDVAGGNFNLYPDVSIWISQKSKWLSHIQSSDYDMFLNELAEQVLAGITYWKNTYGKEPELAMLFNEPLSGNRQLEGHATTQTVVDIIKRSGDRLRQAGFKKTKFIVPSEGSEFESLDTAKAILADSGAWQYVGAIGYHPYPYLSTYSWPPNILETSGKGQPEKSKVRVRNQLRDLVKPYGIKLFMTEVTSGPAAQSKQINPLSYDVFRARAIHIHDEFTYADASAFFGMNSMWDTISQKEHFRGRGYEDDIFADEGDIIRIDNATEKVYITGIGRAIGHYARWINKGAVRIEATSSDPLLQVTAFRDDAKKQVVWVVINNTNSIKTVKFNVDNLTLTGNLTGEQSTVKAYWQKLTAFTPNADNSFNITLPAESVTTVAGQIKKSAEKTITVAEESIKNNIDPEVCDLNKETLRSLADEANMRIGAAVQITPWDGGGALVNEPEYRKVLACEYNIIVPEGTNLQLSDRSRPTRDRFELDIFTYVMDFAKANNMKVHSGHLMWNMPLATEQVAQWVIDGVADGSFGKEELLDIIKEHIQVIMKKYKEEYPGMIKMWTVENEVIQQDGTLIDSIWERNIGPEYLDEAFRFAREADSDAMLIYNGGSEGMNESGGVYKTLQNMINRGVPIDGVGIQDHIELGKDSPAGPSFYWSENTLANDLSDTLELYAGLGKLGLKVFITEMDIDISRLQGTEQQKFKAQAAIYANKLKACALSENCDTFITWGFTDKYTWMDTFLSWLPGKKKPLPFDENYKEKPAYNSMKEVLKSFAPPK